MPPAPAPQKPAGNWWLRRGEQGVAAVLTAAGLVALIAWSAYHGLSRSRTVEIESALAANGPIPGRYQSGPVAGTSHAAGRRPQIGRTDRGIANRARPVCRPRRPASCPRHRPPHARFAAAVSSSHAQPAGRGGAVNVDAASRRVLYSLPGQKRAARARIWPIFFRNRRLKGKNKLLVSAPLAEQSGRMQLLRFQIAVWRPAQNRSGNSLDARPRICWGRGSPRANIVPLSAVSPLDIPLTVKDDEEVGQEF